MPLPIFARRLPGRLVAACAGLAFVISPALRADPPPEDTVKVDKGTESVINGALKYLASQQLADGSWTGDKSSPQSNKWAVAMTSYVMMAYMANGNLPDAGPYAKQVKNGMQFLLDSVQADGTFHTGDPAHYMYMHGLGTMVLAELYGETQNPIIKPKLEHLVLLIVHGQNPEGGWRYQPGSHDADLSVTVPQTVALIGAKRAGIAVPQVTIDRAISYIKRSAVGNTGDFSYQLGRGAGSYARDSAAIYALQITGLFDDPLVKAGSNRVMRYIDRSSDPGWRVEWLTYGSYYSGVAHYLIGGDAWKNYYHNFAQDYLLKHVTTDADGSHWDQSMDPNSKGIGSNWCTAVFTTILSLPYGYLPLYQR
jgi:hypothetical protein